MSDLLSEVPAIKITCLSKAYPLDLTPTKIIEHFFLKKSKKVVLENINLTIPKGQIVGLIGPNGAGKSTLLRLLSGQAKPSGGLIETVGKLLAILQISTGLQDEWTGRQNIRLIGALYGMTDHEISNKENEIIQFAQLEKFIDNPVRTYSSGMRARLAFSLVTSAECDLLLIDEALAVGDVRFAQRCRERMHLLCGKGMTVVIVSHSMTAIRELCDRVIWLDAGRIVSDDLPERVIEKYRLAMLTHAEKELMRRYAHRIRFTPDTLGFEINDMWLKDELRGRSAVIPVSTPFSLIINLNLSQKFNDIILEIEIYRVDGIVLLKVESNKLDLPLGFTDICINFGEMRFGRFTYECRLRALQKSGSCLAERVIVFAVEDHSHSYNSTYYAPINWCLQF